MSVIVIVGGEKRNKKVTISVTVIVSGKKHNKKYTK